MFTDRLTVTLSLGIGGDSFSLTAGQVERFAVDVQSWGFDADVTCYVSAEQEADPIFKAFAGPALIAATLTLGKAADGDDDTLTPLSLTGYVIAKAVSEVVGENLKGLPVVGRRYEMRLVDAAQAFWTRHRPLDLLVQASMQDLLDAHKPVGVSITYDGSAVSTQQAVLAVAVDGEGEPSFYDFVLAWVDRNQGVFEFDATLTQYRIAEKKGRSSSTASELAFEDVAQLRALFPEPPRFNTRVLQAFAEAPLTKELVNPHAAGIRRDVLLRTPIVADVDRRCQLETLRLRASAPGLEIHYRRCPDVLTAPLGFVSVGGGFSERIHPAGTTYRVTRLRASAAHKTDAPVEPEDTSALYQIDLTTTAEDELSPVASLPAFRDARRTLRVEGKIVSAGAAGTRTWAAVENEDNSLWMYKVHIPLFNKEVPAPFAPTFASGHFFFPAYKDQRVLVDLDFDRAAITGFLDWADEGRLPSDSQGNQIMLGFQSSNGTVVRHNYVDAIPVLTVQRKASIETSTLQLADGTLKISLEQSQAVPTTIPLYDVSPRVEAAKDAVIGEVSGSVTVVTTQFETSVAQVAATVDAASTAVQVEIARAERELGGQLDATETELQGMLADATAATATLSMAGERAKARLLSAAQSVDQARAPLLAIQARASVLRTQASLRSKELKGAIGELPSVSAAPLDRLAARATALRGRAADRIAALKAAVETLGPASGGAAFSELTRFRQNVQGLDSDTTQLPSQIEGTLATWSQGLNADWLALETELGTARGAVQHSLASATQSLATAHARVGAKLASKQLTQAPALDSWQQRIHSLQSHALVQLEAERVRADSALATVASTASDARTQLQDSGTTAGQLAIQSLTTLRDELHRVLNSLDTTTQAVQRSAQANLDALSARIDTLQKALATVLDAVPAAIATARESLLNAVQLAVAACDDALSAIDTLLSTLQTAVDVPITAALSAIDTAEKTASATIAMASQTLDTTVQTAQSMVQGFVSTFQGLVDGAITALSAVRALVRGASGQIMPPIDALSSLIEQLQSIFQTGVNLLTAFVDKAHAVLDAIPAASLPKAAVQPAITAVGAALDTVMPLIQAGATAAGDQLTSLGATLTAQAQAAEDTALQAVSSFVATLTQQVEAILPPVKQQLATVQTQIDSAIDATLTQLDAATTTAVQAITQTYQAVGQQAQAAAAAASTQLDTATNKLQQVVTELRAQITAQRQRLETLADQLVMQVASGVDAAAKQLEETSAQIEQAVADTRIAQQAQVSAAVASLQPRVDAVRAKLSLLPGDLDVRLLSLREQNRALALQTAQLVPSTASITAAVSSVLEPLSAAYMALDRALDSL